MKYITKMVALLLCSASLFSTTAVAGNVSIGQNIYANEIGKVCGMDGVKFTDIHTPQEWLIIYEDDKLEEEIRKICPKVKEYNPKWSYHLFAFVYEYGRGSGYQPTCK